ncbi:hypothetical protein CCHR01_08031 [Colletotrichum chrysophilum]|uniref:Uncharacterized protein n=1 Tax=Colletotrichum chrysophilum TaxID=1836956 RepID=A0AAD9AKP6_9PEZI|nr:hypothetical protein CCHR01_08031 [Colletotrichum chrysophilum]
MAHLVTSDSWGQVFVVTALGALLRYSILRQKQAFARRIQQVHDKLGLPESMRITSDIGGGMSDSFCVKGIIGLFIIALTFAALLAISFWNPHVTADDAIGIALAFLIVWWAVGISARWSLEEGPRETWAGPRIFYIL